VFLLSVAWGIPCWVSSSLLLSHQSRLVPKIFQRDIETAQDSVNNLPGNIRIFTVSFDRYLRALLRTGAVGALQNLMRPLAAFLLTHAI